MSVTIKDVAREAGVSTATVSKVMNNSPSIPESTANRIFQIMDELGYKPNRRAQNFATKSTRSVVFAAHFKKNLAFENPHLYEIMTGLQKSLNERGYTLDLVNVTRENCMDILKSIISEKSADAIVLHISIVSKDLEKIILSEEFPHIVIGCPEHKTQLCWVDNNNVLSGEIATEYLYKRGYQRIAFLGGSKYDVGSMNRLQGYLNIHEQKILTIKKEYIFYGESTIESGIEGMHKFLSLDPKPQAVVCANNNMALGAMYELSDRGLLVPKDMGIITFDAFPYTKITRPRLTTVDIDVYDMGRLAGELIIRKIKKPNLSIQSYTTLANLVVNGSTK